MEKFYTVKEFAKLLEVHPNTIRKMIKTKRLHPINVGTVRRSRYKISDEDLLRLKAASFEEQNKEV